MKILIIVLLLSITADKGVAQEQDSTKIDYVKLGIIGGLTAGGFVYGHIIQNDIWWKGEKSKFHFEWDNDWTYALGSDKVGHFFFPYLTTNIYAQAFNWAGIDKQKSFLYAGALALTYQTYIEIRDGFSKKWGFSWGDWGANFLGASYPVLQQYLPELKNYNFKISFYPSQRFKNNSHSVIFDDYESTYHWLSINVYNLLPNNIKEYYPEFINIAIGHSVKRLDYLDEAYHEIYLGLDWNLEGLPGNGWFWNLLKKNLNYYHLPAPAIKITRGVVWYGLKF